MHGVTGAPGPRRDDTVAVEVTAETAADDTTTTSARAVDVGRDDITSTGVTVTGTRSDLELTSLRPRHAVIAFDPGATADVTVVDGTEPMSRLRRSTAQEIEAHTQVETTTARGARQTAAPSRALPGLARPSDGPPRGKASVGAFDVTATGETPPERTPLDRGRPAAKFVNLPQLGWHGPSQVRSMPSAIGPYRVVGEVARGGMAVIYEAKHPTLGRSVAIKVLHAHLGAASTASSCFLAEAVASSRINHPAVVSVFDHGYADDGAAYLVMEFLTGESLGRRLARLKALPVRDAVAIGCELAEALAAAHAIGVVHCDLKPDNVHLTRAANGVEQVKLLDFGVAKVREELTMAPSIQDLLSGASKAARGLVLGTVAYMAPEQLRDRDGVDPRADIYSLGCLLYEMLSGELPYRGDAVELASPDRPPPRSLAARGVPRELDQLVLSMLARYADDRPQSMRDVNVALAGVRAALATRQPPPATRPPTTYVIPKRDEIPWHHDRRIRVLIAIGVSLAVGQILLARLLHLI